MKKQRATYDEDMFSHRVFAIIQLCVAFTAVCWLGGQPFLGDLFTFKSKQVVYESVLGDQTHFKNLPVQKRNKILQDYQELTRKANVPFLTKLKRTFEILAFELSPFTQAWIAFSIVIGVLILLRIDGACQAAWVLPLIALAFLLDNQWHRTDPHPSAEEKLFPSEEVIIRDYLQEPLSTSVSNQRDQLTEGWQLYVVRDWAQEEPSNNPTIFEEQVQKGTFLFNVARIETYSNTLSPHRNEKKLPLFMLLLLLWSGLFAFCVNRKA